MEALVFATSYERLAPQVMEDQAVLVRGLALPIGVNFFTNLGIPISWWSAVIALSTSVIVGIVFGTLPANRAAKLDPVATLKYE